MNNLLLFFSLNLSAVVLGDSNTDDFVGEIFTETGDLSGVGSGMVVEPLQAQIAGLDLDHNDFNPISRGLPWENDLPIFNKNDVVGLQSYLLKEKIRLLTFGKCYEHGFNFGYKDDDLEQLKLSLLRLKIELIEDSLKFSHLNLVVDIKVVDELLELLEAIVELKKKLKPCLLDLLFDAHDRPLFKKADLAKLEVTLLKVKVALLTNIHDPKYFAYDKEYIFKLKLAVLKLQIALIKTPLIFGHDFNYDVKGLLRLVVDIYDLRAQPKRRFDTHGQRIAHGLQWDRDAPKFDTDDVLEITVALLREKDSLFKFDCIKHGFNFGWKDDDLEKINVSILKLKVALLTDPHAYFPKLVLKIKVLEDLLEIVEELKLIKFKLKPCLGPLIELKFDHQGFPLFKIVDLEKLKVALLKLKVELLDGFFSHEFDRYTLKYIQELEVAVLKFKIALLKNPLIIGSHNFDVDDLLKLIKDVLDLKVKFPSKPIIGALEAPEADSFEIDDDVPQIAELSVRPRGPVTLKWRHDGFPLFKLHDLVNFKDDIVDFYKELVFVWKAVQKGSHHDLIFKYKIDVLKDYKEKLLKLKVLLKINPFIFGGTRHAPLKGLVKIAFVVEKIDDVIDLLKKIKLFTPINKHGNGRCSNEFDQLIKNWNLRIVTTKCAKECHFDEDCTSKCVAKKTHLTHHCSTCFGEFVKCAHKNCWFRCMLGEKGCQECADRNCSDDFEKCAFGTWKPNWKRDMGFGWRWGNHLSSGRRRTPFEGTDLFTQAN